MKFLLNLLFLLISFSAARAMENTGILSISTQTLDDVLEAQKINNLSADESNKPTYENKELRFSRPVSKKIGPLLAFLESSESGVTTHATDSPLHAVLKQAPTVKRDSWKNKLKALLRRSFPEQIAVQDANGCDAFHIIARYQNEDLKADVFEYVFDEFMKDIRKTDYFPSAEHFMKAIASNDNQRLYLLSYLFARFLDVANFDAHLEEIRKTFGILLTNLDEPRLARTLNLLCTSKNYQILAHLLESTLRVSETAGAYFIAGLTSLELTTLLAHAIEQQCKSSFHYLVSRGCSVKDAFTKQSITISYDDAEFMIDIFNYADDLNFEFTFSHISRLPSDPKYLFLYVKALTPLIWALYFLDYSAVEQFVARGADVNYTTKDDVHILHCAISLNLMPMVLFLLHNGVDLKKKGTCHPLTEGRLSSLNSKMLRIANLPVHLAILLGNVDILTALLQHNTFGLQSNFSYHHVGFNRTVTVNPLDCALLHNLIPLRKQLLGYKAQSSSNLKNILMLAKDAQLRDHIRNLLLATDVESLSCFWLFAALDEHCPIEIFELLFECGAQLDYLIDKINVPAQASLIDKALEFNRFDVIRLYAQKNPHMKLDAKTRARLLGNDIQLGRPFDYQSCKDLLPSTSMDEQHYLLLAIQAAAKFSHDGVINFLIEDIQWLLKPFKDYPTYLHYVKNPAYLTDTSLNDQETVILQTVIADVTPKIQEKIITLIVANKIHALKPLLGLLPLNFLYSPPVLGNDPARKVQETIAHTAVRLGHLDIVALLLDVCPDLLTMKDSDGVTVERLLQNNESGVELLKKLAMPLEHKLKQLVKEFGNGQVNDIFQKIINEHAHAPD